MIIRSPYEKAGNVYWLPRLIDKTRMALDNELPAEYQNAYCNPKGMDGIFMRHFGLREDLIVEEFLNRNFDDESIGFWFGGLNSIDDLKLTRWDKLAPNIGRAGYPGEGIFKWAKAKIYTGIDQTGCECLFDLIDRDEGRELMKRV